MEISIIIGFRNRELERVKHALNSLANQSLKNFEVIFIDYGSDESIAQETKALVSKYDFAKYIYSDTRGWFWNRAHALNTGIKKANGDVLLFFDIDLILELDFLLKIAALDYKSNYYTFHSFYLPQYFDFKGKDLSKEGTKYEHNYIGLFAVSKNMINAIDGYDEYFMVWGVEDNDIYKKLNLRGLYRNELPVMEYQVYHQFHETHSPNQPTMWYLNMVDYHFSDNKEFVHKERGKLIQITDRPILKNIMNNSFEVNIKLDQNSLYIFNHIIESVHYKQSGCFVYDRKVSENTFGIYKLFKKRQKTSSKKTEVTTISHFLQWLVGINRHLFIDYFIEEKPDQIMFCFLKK